MVSFLWPYQNCSFLAKLQWKLFSFASHESHEERTRHETELLMLKQEDMKQSDFKTKLIPVLKRPSIPKSNKESVANTDVEIRVHTLSMQSD